MRVIENQKFWSIGRSECGRGPLVFLATYAELEQIKERAPLAIRGAGLSLAGHGFGENCSVLDLSSFSRILDWNPGTGSIHVEAGMKIGDLLAFLFSKGREIAVLPGYPDITVGGCIASCVHGKNPIQDGTFYDVVEEITLFHPSYGVQTVSRTKECGLFELTVGGLGLTGVILSARLKTTPLSGRWYDLDVITVGNISETLDLLKQKAPQQKIAYSVHDFSMRTASPGKGAVFLANPAVDEGDGDIFPRRQNGSRHIRGRLNIPLCNPLFLKLLNRAFIYSSKRTSAVSHWQMQFPWIGKELYFRCYGNKGFIEHQTLVPWDRAPAYAKAVCDLFHSAGLSSGMFVMKPFGGTPRFLRFAGDGISIAFHVPNSAKSAQFLRNVDALDYDFGARANVVKDGRLPSKAASIQYTDYSEFADRVRKRDPARLFSSVATSRLGL